MKPTEIITNRFVLRPLGIKDATPLYSSWLDESTSKEFINASRNAHEIEDLRTYISERLEREDVLFMGIFTLEGDSHIGNIKFEPVDTYAGYAVMGLLIGEVSWRGKGVAVEVIKASAEWLMLHRNISQIVLGVSRDNVAAIRAYEKAGFVQETTKLIPSLSNDNMSMVFHANVRQS